MITPLLHRICAALVASLVVLALVPAGAHAGQYTVRLTCSNWSPFDSYPGHIAAYASCPGFVIRNVVGNFSSGPGPSAGMQFFAPSGTSIASFTLAGDVAAINGWRASGVLLGGTSNGAAFFTCPPQCSLNSAFSFGAGNAGGLQLRVACAAASCPNGGSGPHGLMVIEGSTVTLNDGTPPTVALPGGSLVSGGWKRGTLPVRVSAADNTGIGAIYVLVDGAVRASAPFGCNYAFVVPCANRATALNIATSALADGTHTVRVEAVDGSGNPGFSGLVQVTVDNTPPDAPHDLHLADAAAWRATNSFSVSWTNPAQAFAPIAGAVYRLCPDVSATAAPEIRQAAAARCETGIASGPNLSQLPSLHVPQEGAWTLSLYLVDAAGNAQPTNVVQIGGLDYDGTPPTGLAFLPASPQDPARVTVRAIDPVSGIASGTIEIRRTGQAAWRPLPTHVTPVGLTAVVDDETLRQGAYSLRATATNGAGLEASTNRTSVGTPASVTLPLRGASHLKAGVRPPRCRRRCTLQRQPRVSLGRSTVLRGRLTVPGVGTGGTVLQVWRKLELAGAGWTQMGTLKTSPSGAFVYRVHNGPAETLRFRYPGTATIRGRNIDVALRVQAASSLRPSRRVVINGEYVTFRGRLKGGWIPDRGVLVQLQVYTRGQWRTFAQPRAATNGRWSYQYRFETVRGRATFRFRARIPQQFGYPFASGGSRPIRVQVRGL